VFALANGGWRAAVQVGYVGFGALVFEYSIRDFFECQKVDGVWLMLVENLCHELSVIELMEGAPSELGFLMVFSCKVVLLSCHGPVFRNFWAGLGRQFNSQHGHMPIWLLEKLLLVSDNSARLATAEYICAL
jgi:hypothetical protein